MSTLLSRNYLNTKSNNLQNKVRLPLLFFLNHLQEHHTSCKSPWMYLLNYHLLDPLPTKELKVLYSRVDLLCSTPWTCQFLGESSLYFRTAVLNLYSRGLTSGLKCSAASGPSQTFLSFLKYWKLLYLTKPSTNWQTTYLNLSVSV